MFTYLQVIILPGICQWHSTFPTYCLFSNHLLLITIIKDEIIDASFTTPALVIG